MQIVTTNKLSKFYGSKNNQVKALNGLDLSVEKGAFLGVIGASGSGKTTLLNLLGGIDKPTKGQVIIDGVDLYSLSETERTIFRRRQIGFIFQSYNLVPVLNAWENIVLPIELDGLGVDEAYIKDLMVMLKIYDRRHHLPSALSGGQQQRVAIARALATNPAIILADEPTGNLDSENSIQVMELLKLAVEKYQTTLILITHNEAISAMASQVIRLKDGQIVGGQ